MKVLGLILILLSASVTASPMTFGDDPPFVKLSDGRIVPYGQGVICSDECRPPAPVDPTDAKLKRWVITGAVVGTIVLVAGSRGGGGRVPLEIPNSPSSPLTPVSEPGLLCLLGSGLVVVGRLLKKKGKPHEL